MLILAISSDGPVGRVDVGSLTDQQHMELFFVPDYEKAIHGVFGGDPDDACTWKGVTCSEDERIELLMFDTAVSPLLGSVCFAMLPPAVIRCILFRQPMYGEIDTRALPRVMREFEANQCRFTGTVDLGSLPDTLQTLYIGGNQVTDIRNICNLPKSLYTCCVHESSIVKEEVYVHKMPSTGLHVSLASCKIDKVVCEDQIDRRRVFISKKR